MRSLLSNPFLMKTTTLQHQLGNQFCGLFVSAVVWEKRKSSLSPSGVLKPHPNVLWHPVLACMWHLCVCVCSFKFEEDSTSSGSLDLQSSKYAIANCQLQFIETKAILANSYRPQGWPNFCSPLNGQINYQMLFNKNKKAKLDYCRRSCWQGTRTHFCHLLELAKVNCGKPKRMHVLNGYNICM